MEKINQSSLDYFGGDELASQVFLSKYALKDYDGNLLEKTPEDMHHRLAKEFARIEAKYPNSLLEEKIFSLLDHFKYLVPQGGPMAGIGNPYQVTSLSNCFVIGTEGPSDSYGSILKIDEEQVQLMKRRGGVGHDLSHIRPNGSPVKNSAITSTGLVSFMERYSRSTLEVAQDGRRGALMLTVNINHPDVEKFIDAKIDSNKVTGANISVKITNKFMQAIINNCYSNEKNIWNKIIHNAWKSAEPGVLFWDKILNESIPDCYADLGFQTISTNPCGEIPLCAYDSCRLLAINLLSYVQNPFGPNAFFDYSLFTQHILYAMRLMDDMIDLEIEKIDLILHKIDSDPENPEIKRTEHQLWKKIKKKAILGRRTGLGITAEGDMLAAMNLRYGSPKGNNLSEQVHKTLATIAYRSSIQLAKERGSFPIFSAHREKDNPFLKRLCQVDSKLNEPRRNIACLTIAPAGTVSLMTQTTSGIEPLFAPIYHRRRRRGEEWQEYTILHPPFLRWMKKKGFTNQDYTLSKLEDIQTILKCSPWYKSTAQDMNPIDKIWMQGRIQQWIDHSISCTVNIPAETTEEKVGQIYMKAWEFGCKGCTIYREGSRQGIMVTASSKKPILINRPYILESDVVRFQNNKEKWIAFIGLIESGPYEIFTGPSDKEEGIFLPKYISKGIILKNIDETGKKRYDFQYINKKGEKMTVEGLSVKFNPEYWNYAKLISGVMRYGMPIERIIKIVQSLQLDDVSINTWKNGVERALKKYVKEGSLVNKKICPNCKKETIVYQEGCLICTSCGVSQCG